MSQADAQGTLGGAVSQEEVPHHARREREIKSVNMQLNLTSMIDVIFQLLIYFVITASFAVGEGVITAKLPEGTGVASASTELPKQPLNILLQSQGGYDVRIGIEGIPQAPANFTQLNELLVQIQYDPSQGRTSGAYKPDNPVIIKPDGRVRWQHVVNAFNAAVKARYSNVSFAQARTE